MDPKVPIGVAATPVGGDDVLRFGDGFGFFVGFHDRVRVFGRGPRDYGSPSGATIKRIEGATGASIFVQ